MSPEDVFDQYHEAVFRFLYRLTRCTETAEDLTQDCFLAYLRTPRRFDSTRGTLKTFLFAIARNLALKHYRDLRLEVPLDEEQWQPAEPAGIQIELSLAVEAAVASLPLLQQEAVILFEYEGATLAEIAAIVDAEVGTVKSRLHRARETLKRSLAPYNNSGDRHEIA
jgi:RNA polymerase sigma-70 factor, ECF subfamily